MKSLSPRLRRFLKWITYVVVVLSGFAVWYLWLGGEEFVLRIMADEQRDQSLVIFSSDLKVCEDAKDVPRRKLQKFFTFDWDSLYLFEPYTTIESIKEVTNTTVDWAGVEQSNIHTRDNYHLIVFVKDQVIVNYYKLPRNERNDQFIVQNKEKEFAKDGGLRVEFLAKDDSCTWYLTYSEN